MRLVFKAYASIALSAALLPAGAASAQDAIAIQTMVEQSLFEVRGRVDRNAAAAGRRAASSEQRVERQDAMLRAQELTVQRLAGEVRTLKDERELSRSAEAFAAGLASNDGVLLRSLLADIVTIGDRTVPADVLVSELARSPARSPASASRRSNMRVSIDGDRAVVTSSGDDWRRFAASGLPVNRRSDDYEVSFARALESWKIDGLAFRSR